MAGVLNAYLSDDDKVVLVTREGGRRVTRAVRAEHVAYFLATDLAPALQRELRESRYVCSYRPEGRWLRVGFVDSNVRRGFCTGAASPIVQRGIAAYEGDVSPVMRHVVDHGLSIERPRRAYLDIETCGRVPFRRKEEMRVLSWAIVDDGGGAHVAGLAEDCDGAERDLLGKMWEALEAYDQVLAWSGDRFDFPVIWARSQRRGIKGDARGWLWLDQLKVFERMNMNSSESGAEKQSMKLGAIAQEVVGEGKDQAPPDVVARFGDREMGALSWDMWSAGGEWRRRHLRYNLQDTDLLRKIERKTGFVELFQTVCEVCSVFPDSQGLNPTKQMDGYMLKLGLARDHHFPTKRFYEEGPKFKGADVMQPTCKGITRNVHVADFASLYPSIILSWNMSPETRREGVAINGPIPEGMCRAPLTGIAFDALAQGMLPLAVSEMIRERKNWSEEQARHPPGTDEHQDAKRRSTAFKVVANTFYGVVGSPYSRYFERRVAESVSQTGAWLIRLTISEAKAGGFDVVYGDTDSLFAVGGDEARFAAFVAHCNENLYPAALRKLGCPSNHVKLAYEKAFERVVFTSAKRYAGRWLHYKGKPAAANSRPEIKGLEFKRGDAGLVARELQARMIDLICGGLGLNPGKQVPTEDVALVHEVLAEFRARVLEGELRLPEVKIVKSLSKSIREYAQKVKKDGTMSAQPTHVVVAKLLEERGEDVGEGARIEYVVVDGNVAPMRAIPAADYVGEFDRYHLWEALVYPPTQRLLAAAFPDNDWEAWGKVRPRDRHALPGQLALFAK
jgi:DNA polymerase I